MKRTFQKPKRVVVKIGSSSLCHKNGQLDHTQIESICDQIACLRKREISVILVLSGAVAAGRHILNESGSSVDNQQAAAAIGQPILMSIFQQAFRTHDLHVAQILLTHDDLNNRQRYLNARNTLENLISHRILPIINENDTVSTEEIRFSDNDFLGALCTNLVNADLFIILSDIDGIAEEDPKVNPEARKFDFLTVTRLREFQKRYIRKFAGEKNGDKGLGRGGLITKLEAPRMAARYGVSTIIANSRIKNVLPRLVAGEPLGTMISPDKDRLNSWKAYIAHALKPKAAIIIDDGAARALIEKKGSLLASGVILAKGHFQRGDGIRCCREDGSEVARGIVEYSSEEINKIAGAHSAAIEKILGFRYRKGVIHRNNMVITEVK